MALLIKQNEIYADVTLLLVVFEVFLAYSLLYFLNFTGTWEEIELVAQCIDVLYIRMRSGDLGATRSEL